MGSRRALTHMGPSAGKRISRTPLCGRVSSSGRPHQPTDHRRLGRTWPTCRQPLERRLRLRGSPRELDPFTPPRPRPAKNLQPFATWRAGQGCLRDLYSASEDVLAARWRLGSVSRRRGGDHWRVANARSGGPQCLRNHHTRPERANAHLALFVFF